MNVKKCTVEKRPPREVDVCEVMRKAKQRRATEKAGRQCCPEPPEPPPPPPPPDCFGICIERIKNPNFTTASKTSVIRCKSIPKVPPKSEICDEYKKTLRSASEEY